MKDDRREAISKVLDAAEFEIVKEEWVRFKVNGNWHILVEKKTIPS